MSEYEDDNIEYEYVDEPDEERVDLEAREQIEALHDQVSEQNEIAAINATISSLERKFGTHFSRAEAQELGEYIDAGHEPGAAARSLGLERDDNFDAKFEQTLERVELERGKGLLESEVDKLWEEAQYRDDPRHVAKDVLHDLSSRQGRVTFADERLKEQQQAAAPEPKPVEPLFEDATPAERVAHIDARFAAAEADPEPAEEE